MCDEACTTIAINAIGRRKGGLPLECGIGDIGSLPSQHQSLDKVQAASGWLLNIGMQRVG